MKKYVFTLIAVLLFTSSAFGVASNRRYYHIAVMDQWGEIVTSPAITQIDVQNESGTAVAVYSTKSGSTEVGSTGVITSGLADGMTEFWYADTAIDLTVTDGTRSYEIESFSVRTSRFMLPSFLVSTSSYNLGQTNDLDFTYGSWILDGDTTNRLDMIPDNDGGILGIGDTSTQADIYIYSSSTRYLFWDEGNYQLNFTHSLLLVDDDSYLYFGDGKDISVKFDNSNDDLDITGDGSEIAIGATGAGLDIVIWGQTGNYVEFDEDNDRLYLEDINLRIDDGSDIEFYHGTGTAVDWKVECATAERLAFIPTETTDDQVFHIGDADHTADVVIYMLTAGETLTIDAGADSMTFVGDLALFTLTGTTKPFFANITGTVAGIAAEIQTTDGGITLDANGGTNGDINIEAADILTLNSADTKIFDGAAAETWIIEGTANDHEASIVFTDPTADVVYTVPVAAASTLSFMVSTLATNAPDIANSVTGGTSTLIFEGSAVDNHEHTVTATNPTADVVWTLPDAAAMTVSFMSSTLATNMPGVVNSVTGGTNQLIFEGTADGFETILTATDATKVDKTITIPNATSGTLLVRSYTAHTTNGNIDASTAWGGVHTNTGSSGDIELEMPSAVAGMEITVFITVACDVDIDAASGDQILHLTDTVADSISSDKLIGSHVTLYALDATNWIPIAASGPWADAGA